MGPATGAVSACCPTNDQGPDSLPNNSCGECIEQGDDEEDFSDNREPCRQKALLSSGGDFYFIISLIFYEATWRIFLLAFSHQGVAGGWVGPDSTFERLNHFLPLLEASFNGELHLSSAFTGNCQIAGSKPSPSVRCPFA